MTLRESRVLFTSCVGQLLSDVRLKAWSYGKVEVAVDEWTVHTPRRVRLRDGGIAWLEDAVHKLGSRHHEGLGLDLLVYINGVYVERGSHPIWYELDAMAKAINPHFSFGIEFNDSNHLSWREGDEK